ncbi:GIY-YIG nuclease family protein [Pedobacter sp. MW01-1-1]|uniref:GIY-YIG nuclease family protein n=1 Tax=Pedobacter sp. MW01-1-1 TaxID=3383027 RepID=UPI003FEE6E33
MLSGRYSPQRVSRTIDILRFTEGCSIKRASFFCYMFNVYILYSKKLNRYYVGYTEDLEKRLEQHNTGFSKYTSKAEDWEVCYSESFISRALAHKRELEIKAKKSRKYIEWLISKD